ncbi:phosphoribosyltransferase domain-containing protein [Clostridium sp. AM58-1XD]|uniref:phosphoribosyltransferase domain-containing protein n=1 Tax=Clostridium sp. AM58-1XD TaxID=2292307 RepID=UPI0015F356ED|nr:phosphoribosyltransferase domain-containing protein [Clostridium sp. AM58-1XD]
MRIYEEQELMKIAKRDNNTKRSYLLVNPLQGKHIPVQPSRCIHMVQELAGKVSDTYAGERLLLIGFAETATAIGAIIAENCPEVMFYMHTTREQVEGSSNFLYFSEIHSHATEQRLATEKLDEMIRLADRIVFAEDEVTTGNTIWNLIQCMRERYEADSESDSERGSGGGRERKLAFGIVSVLNGMDESNSEKFDRAGIKRLFLKKISGRDFTAELERYDFKGEKEDFSRDMEEEKSCRKKGERIIYSAPGRCEPRLGVEPVPYLKASRNLAHFCIWLAEKEPGWDWSGKRALFLGTEEFMYPALKTAQYVEEECSCDVRFHATTRSPILPDAEEGYPLQSRAELKSVYDGERTTYIYNLDSYDVVFLMSDTRNYTAQGIESLTSALEAAGNSKIYIVRWSE